jgi:hypothetical protein
MANGLLQLQTDMFFCVLYILQQPGLLTHKQSEE